MDSVLTQLGVGGILIVLVLKMVFDFLDKRKNGRELIQMQPDSKEDTGRIKTLLHKADKHERETTEMGKELHDHCMEARYEREEIKRLASSINSLTGAIGKLNGKLGTIEGTTGDIAKDVSKLLRKEEE